jgi:hypothetical protein
MRRVFRAEVDFTVRIPVEVEARDEDEAGEYAVYEATRLSEPWEVIRGDIHDLEEVTAYR